MMEPVNNGSFPKRLQILNRSILHTYGAFFYTINTSGTERRREAATGSNKPLFRFTDNAVCFQKDKSQL